MIWYTCVGKITFEATRTIIYFFIRGGMYTSVAIQYYQEALTIVVELTITTVFPFE